MSNNILKDYNLKSTKNRTLILSAFNDNSLPLCAEELYIKLDKKINIATIYRNLNLLSDKGILTRFVFEDGKMYYKLNNDKHTHKLVCNVCHKITSIKNCPMELISNNITKDTGYLITGHNLEVKGICPKCNKQT